MPEKSDRIIDMPFVTRNALDKTITEPAEQLVCPECGGAFELDFEAIDYGNDFEVDCPECEETLEVRPYALVSLNPIAFTPTQDVAEFLDAYDNKTAVLNAAVRLLRNSIQEG